MVTFEQIKNPSISKGEMCAGVFLCDAPHHLNLVGLENLIKNEKYNYSNCYIHSLFSF